METGPSPAEKVALSEPTATPAKRTPKIVKRLVKKQPWETMLENNPALQKAISVLPTNYEFEIPKCLYKIKESKAKVVALQMPEGLLFCVCILSDIFTQFAQVRVLILSDVTYGACCIDDFTAEKLGAELLIHYGHSCLVPIQNTRIKTIYIFVEIYFDLTHITELLLTHFPKGHRIALQGTVQFLRAVAQLPSLPQIQEHFNTKHHTNDATSSSSTTTSTTIASNNSNGLNHDSTTNTTNNKNNNYETNNTISTVNNTTIHDTSSSSNKTSSSSNQNTNHSCTLYIPQVKPLSPGETLGCTSAALPLSTDAVLFLADGRFHMEATMIRNYHLYDVGNDRGVAVPFFRYDPYAKVMTQERYDTPLMVATRKQAIDRILHATTTARVFGVILGTLGRQGNTQILERLTQILEKLGKVVIKVLMAELAPWKLQILSGFVDCWVQIACPRLSIDWAAREYEGGGGSGGGNNNDNSGKKNSEGEQQAGGGFGGKPVLTPYECLVAVGHIPWQATFSSSSSSSSSNSTHNSNTTTNNTEEEDIERRRAHYRYPMDYYSGENNLWNNYYKEPTTTTVNTTTTNGKNNVSNSSSTNNNISLSANANTENNNNNVHGNKNITSNSSTTYSEESSSSSSSSSTTVVVGGFAIGDGI